MRVQLQYAQVEAALVSLNQIADSKLGAFRARLRHLRVKGLPEGTNTGKGQRATFSALSYLQMVLATELMQVGFSPSRIVKMIKGNWYNLEFDALVALSDQDYLDQLQPPISLDQREFAWTFSAEALRDLSFNGDGEYDYHDAIVSVPLSQLSEVINSSFIYQEDKTFPIVGEPWRTVVINGSALIVMAIGTLIVQNEDISREDVWSDIRDHLVERGRRLEELSKLFHERSSSGS